MGGSGCWKRVQPYGGVRTPDGVICPDTLLLLLPLTSQHPSQLPGTSPAPMKLDPMLTPTAPSKDTSPMYSLHPLAHISLHVLSPRHPPNSASHSGSTSRY